MINRTAHAHLEILHLREGVILLDVTAGHLPQQAGQQRIDDGALLFLHTAARAQQQRAAPTHVVGQPFGVAGGQTWTLGAISTL